MDRIITSEILVAYSQCHRKAYLILCSNEKGIQCPEYIRILKLRQLANQNKHINILQQKNPNIAYSGEIVQ